MIHALRYGTWLVGQVIKESVIMGIDLLGTGRNIAPVVIYYPLRVSSERDIAAFQVSITMTPGTLALGVTGPKEVDYDAIDGNRDRRDTRAVAANEYGRVGADSTQRFMAVHAVYGSDPQAIFDSLADMESRLVPGLPPLQLDDIDKLVEKGRPGPRGFRGSRGGRASNETAFDIDKATSTGDAKSFVASILGTKEDPQ